MYINVRLWYLRLVSGKLLKRYYSARGSSTVLYTHSHLSMYINALCLYVRRLALSRLNNPQKGLHARNSNTLRNHHHVHIVESS